MGYTPLPDGVLAPTGPQYTLASFRLSDPNLIHSYIIPPALLPPLHTHSFITGRPLITSLNFSFSFDNDEIKNKCRLT